MKFNVKKCIAIGGVLLVVVGVLAVAAFWPIEQSAVAVASLQPMAGSMETGQQFSQKLIVRSSKPANAVDLTVHYPADQIEVVSAVSKQSRFDMVLFQPKIDAAKGTVRFVQATVSPFSGQGDDGLVGTIVFKARQAGQPSITVAGKVVANDSQGTDLAVKPRSKVLWQVVLGR